MPFLIECDHIKGLILKAFDLHPRGTIRHAGHGNADHVEPFREEALDVLDWNMAFDNVAIHDGCMAGLKSYRYLVLDLDIFQRVQINDLDRKSIFFQVFSPAVAAASGGILVNCHGSIVVIL